VSKPGKISRRTVLRGLGTAIALPWLEAMSPALSLANASSTTKPFPTRMAFFYVPNGVHMADWTPPTDGTDFELPYILEPLKAFKDDMLVLSGLAQDNAFAKGDGPGDHARSLACFLTGVHPKKTDGANIKAGISVDQVAAQRVGNRTRFPSLELGCDRGAQSGNCDSGYSCAYSSNISWRSESVPTGKEINPRLVFERLFSNHLTGEVGTSRAKRERYKQSILDFVAEDARALQTRLGANDQRKVDEYLTSLRELEIRLTRSETEPSTAADTVPGFTKPVGIPKDYQEHIRLMCDLLLLAFQGDLTRVSTFMYANEGSNKSYSFLGVPEGHHDLSHHGNDINKFIKISQINNFHMTQFAYLLEKMKSIREGDGTMLDNTMIVYGSGIGDGNRHNHDDLPIILVGRGGGTIQTGRHVRHPRRTPLNNLFLAMLDRMEASTDALGDSNGRLETLTV
jgi:hypothetical protein